MSFEKLVCFLERIIKICEFKIVFIGISRDNEILVWFEKLFENLHDSE